MNEKMKSKCQEIVDSQKRADSSTQGELRHGAPFGCQRKGELWQKVAHNAPFAVFFERQADDFFS